MRQHFKTAVLADRLGINPETLRRAAARGELRPIRVGRDMIWPEPDVWRGLNGTGSLRWRLGRSLPRCGKGGQRD